MLTQVDPIVKPLAASGGMEVRLNAFYEEEVNKQQSYMGNKSEHCWLGHAIDHATSPLLA